MPVPLLHVDAFTPRAFRGNPAAVCLLNSWLDDENLRKVASENNLPATAFVVPIGDPDQAEAYDLRWFTPTCEIRLCGHGTLAAAHALLNEFMVGKRTDVHFHTRFHGSLWVRRDHDKLRMDFPALFPKPCPSRPAILISALGAQSPVAVSAANETYFVELESEEEVRQMSPNSIGLESLHPYVVAVTARGGDCDFVSRYFAPSYGVDEDTVTGSAHCALAPYWAQRLNKTRLFARQLSERGGELWCQVEDERVTLLGQAVTILRGTLNL